MYRPESGIAEEFIDDQEIKDTLAYADANKNNKELILSIIEKAKKLKGISHREASVLLACEDKELIQKVFDLAIKIKEEFYGNRIVMFAPLYLANFCVNGCTSVLIIIKINISAERNYSGRDQERSYRSSGYGA